MKGAGTLELVINEGEEHMVSQQGSVQSAALEMSAPVSDEMALRRAFGFFPTGVLGVGAVIEGAPVGLAVTSFTSVSLDPPLVSICVARTSKTWPKLAAQPRIGVNVLASEHDLLCRRLASQVQDRFAGARWHASEQGAVLIEGSALWLECEVVSTLEGGDHEIVLMEVKESQLFPGVTPLIFHHSQLRGLPPEE